MEVFWDVYQSWPVDYQAPFAWFLLMTAGAMFAAFLFFIYKFFEL